MKALLIQHKDAGNGATSRKALTAALKEAGWKVDYLPRKKADAEAIAKAGADLVVVAGGDGTVAKIVRMLPDRQMPVAVIPTGTANDIARSLGIEGKPEKIIAGWDIDRRQRLDIGNAEGPWGCRSFVEGVGFGAFADSLRRAPEADGPAKLRAGRAALTEAVAEAAPLPLDLALDGEPLPDALLMAEFMILALAGPRLALAPGADPGDARLHVSWLPEAQRSAMAAWLGRGGRGDAPVETASGREAVIRGGGIMMRIDDESQWLEPGSEVTIRLEGEPVQILAPARAPALAG